MSAGLDDKMRFWDTDTGRLLRTIVLPDGENFICDLVFHPAGNSIAYEGMNIAGAIGFTEGQKTTLKALIALG